MLIPLLIVWYPRPLFTAAGSGRVVVLCAILAAMLGPLAGHLWQGARITLPRSGRRTIAAAQLIALAGCALALYVQRPVYLVYTLDRFDLVLARNLDPRDLAKASRPEFARRPLDGPKYVAARPPSDQAEVQRILDLALDGGKDLQMFPQHYVPYAGEARHALARAKPLDMLLRRGDGAVARYLASSGHTQGSLRFLPMRAPGRDGAVLLDAISGLPIAILLVEPW